MTKTEVTRALRIVLAQLYSTLEDAKRVAHDAGLNLAFLKLGSSPTNDWHNILTEADKQNKLVALLAIVAEEYGDSVEFQRAYANYRALFGQSAALPPPVPGGHGALSIEPARESLPIGKDIVPPVGADTDPTIVLPSPLKPSPMAAATVTPLTALRMDVAVPDKVTLGRVFQIAVAVRQPASPPLKEADLPVVRSGQAQVIWPTGAAAVRLRVQVSAPECDIDGEAGQSFRLAQGQDSPIFYFSLTPKSDGPIGIVVTLYQEEDVLGSTRIQTLSRKQRAGKVKVVIHSEPVEHTKSPQPPIKILFLAANPRDTDHLQLDEEVRAIDQALRLSNYRDRFVLDQQWAVRFSDLQGILLRFQPTIVHFSGHGSQAGELILLENSGDSHPVAAQTLGKLFAILKDNIRCVVLNACYSEAQAQAIAQQIEAVVGMQQAIGDEAAIHFASAFYQALGYGRSVQDAFDLGRLQIDLANLPEEQTPQLRHTPNRDPAKLILVAAA
jgi:hypothetical protein